jgi:hypothetical protein
MKTIKNIFFDFLRCMGCPTKDEFKSAANQESKWESYSSLLAMIMHLMIMLFMVCCIILISIAILILMVASIIECPMILVGFVIIVCLPYIAMLFLRYITKKEQKHENKN